MKICNKYNIAPEDFQRMINDGLVGCQWPRYEKIYEDFKRLMSVPGAVKTRVIYEISANEGISERHIRDIISRFD